MCSIWKEHDRRAFECVERPLKELRLFFLRACISVWLCYPQIPCLLCLLSLLVVFSWCCYSLSIFLAYWGSFWLKKLLFIKQKGLYLAWNVLQNQWIGKYGLLVQVPGGNMRDSFLVNGVAFKKTFSYAGFEQQPKKFLNPKILLLNIELELKSEKENAEIR